MEVSPDDIVNELGRAMRGITVIFLLAALVLLPSAASAKPGNTAQAQHIERMVKSYLPDESIDVRQVNRGFAISGALSSAESAAKAMQIVRQYVSKDTDVLNFTTVKTGQQVMLRVRIGEIDRTALKTLSTLFTPSAGASRVTSHVDRMERGGTFKMLAEPNLVAMSGEKAEFTTGGEVPVPGMGHHGGQLHYKEYGVKLSFMPLVLAENRIRLHVEPEVTEMRDRGAIEVKGNMAPAIATHKAKTTVELAPGESFMIAGLVKDHFRVNTKDSFFGESFTHNERELVMIVTPYLVDPVPNHGMRLPTDSFSVGSELDAMFQRHIEDPKNQTGMKQPKSGRVGYIVE